MGADLNSAKRFDASSKGVIDDEAPKAMLALNAMVEEATDASRSLASEASALAQIVASFRINGSDETARRLAA